MKQASSHEASNIEVLLTPVLRITETSLTYCVSLTPVCRFSDTSTKTISLTAVWRIITDSSLAYHLQKSDLLLTPVLCNTSLV